MTSHPHLNSQIVPTCEFLWEEYFYTAGSLRGSSMLLRPVEREGGLRPFPCIDSYIKTIYVNPSWGVSLAGTELMFIEQDNEHLGAILRPFPLLYLMGQCKALLKERKLDRTWGFTVVLILAAARVIKSFQGRVATIAVRTWKEFLLCYNSRI